MTFWIDNILALNLTTLASEQTITGTSGTAESGSSFDAVLASLLAGTNGMTAGGESSQSNAAAPSEDAVPLTVTPISAIPVRLDTVASVNAGVGSQLVPAELRITAEDGTVVQVSVMVGLEDTTGDTALPLLMLSMDSAEEEEELVHMLRTDGGKDIALVLSDDNSERFMMDKAIAAAINPVTVDPVRTTGPAGEERHIELQSDDTGIGTAVSGDDHIDIQSGAPVVYDTASPASKGTDGPPAINSATDTTEQIGVHTKGTYAPATASGEPLKTSGQQADVSSRPMTSVIPEKTSAITTPEQPATYSLKQAGMPLVEDVLIPKPASEAQTAIYIESSGQSVHTTEPIQHSAPDVPIAKVITDTSVTIPEAVPSDVLLAEVPVRIENSTDGQSGEYRQITHDIGTVTLRITVPGSESATSAENAESVETGNAAPETYRIRFVSPTEQPAYEMNTGTETDPNSTHELEMDTIAKTVVTSNAAGKGNVSESTVHSNDTIPAPETDTILKPGDEVDTSSQSGKSETTIAVTAKSSVEQAPGDAAPVRIPAEVLIHRNQSETPSKGIAVSGSADEVRQADTAPRPLRNSPVSTAMVSSEAATESEQSVTAKTISPTSTTEFDTPTIPSDRGQTTRQEIPPVRIVRVPGAVDAEIQPQQQATMIGSRSGINEMDTQERISSQPTAAQISIADERVPVTGTGTFIADSGTARYPIGAGEHTDMIGTTVPVLEEGAGQTFADTSPSQAGGTSVQALRHAGNSVNSTSVFTGEALPAVNVDGVVDTKPVIPDREYPASPTAVQSPDVGIHAVEKMIPAAMTDTQAAKSAGSDTNRQHARAADSETRTDGTSPARTATQAPAITVNAPAGSDSAGTSFNRERFPETGVMNTDLASSQKEGDSVLAEAPAEFEVQLGIAATDMGTETVSAKSVRVSSGSAARQAMGDPTAITGAIVRHASIMVRNGESSAEIRLDPPSLGKMKLDIVTENGKITGKITVESAEVRDLIQQNLAQLRENLAQSGLKVQSFDVQVGHNGGTDNWARKETAQQLSGGNRTRSSGTAQSDIGGPDTISNTAARQAVSMETQLFDRWI